MEAGSPARRLRGLFRCQGRVVWVREVDEKKMVWRARQGVGGLRMDWLWEEGKGAGRWLVCVTR